MKIQRTITLDIEVWAEAKKKYPNISERINELVAADLTMTEDKEEVTKADYERQKAITAALQAKIASSEKKKEEKYLDPAKVARKKYQEMLLEKQKNND